MSTSAKCDKCGASGSIKGYRMAPQGWLYLCAFDSEKEDPRDAGDFVVMFACSRECAAALWQEGPGPKLDQLVGSRRFELEREDVRKGGYFTSWATLPPNIKAEIQAQIFRKIAIEGAGHAGTEIGMVGHYLRERLRCQGKEPTADQVKSLEEIDQIAQSLAQLALDLEGF